MVSETADFTRSLPVRDEFAAVLDGALYRPLPDDWLVALTDVVDSRGAIAAGRYKAVNMAGVAMISAVMNALGTRDLPFIFGGDGSIMAIAPSDEQVVADVLARTAAWVRDDLGLELRAALIPVEALRAEGLDVRVEATRISEALCNYAFSGGGIARAEVLLKQGAHAIAPAQRGSRPDLTGLSCRWAPIRQEGRSFVSIIAEPKPGMEAGFPASALALMRLAGMGAGDAAGSPMPPKGPAATWPPAAQIDLEARARGGAGPLALRRLKLALFTFFTWTIFTIGRPFGSFDPVRYRRFTSLNTDYRKFQDGLRITVSLDDAELKKLTGFLEKEREAGHLRYGLCVQDSAILTCYVPSVSTDAHMHFLDGAGGGYAGAAGNMRG